MRKLFHTVAALSALVATSMTANAADVTARPYSPPPYVPPAYVAPVFTWTGFYLGGNIGGAWRNDNLSDTLSGLNFSNGNNNGVFIGGGQVGFNSCWGPPIPPRRHFHPEQPQHSDGEGGDQLPVQLEWLPLLTSEASAPGWPSPPPGTMMCSMRLPPNSRMRPRRLTRSQMAILLGTLMPQGGHP